MVVLVLREAKAAAGPLTLASGLVVPLVAAESDDAPVQLGRLTTDPAHDLDKPVGVTTPHRVFDGGEVLADVGRGLG